MRMQSRKSASLSRRQFVLRSGMAATAFQIVPGHVLGLNGAQSANERVNIAGIGLGRQGSGDINQFKDHNIVALCDVDSATAAGSFKRFPNAKKYTDYREMLEKQKDIDAV